MAKIIKLEIKNFRGIAELEHEFNYDQNLICLIGRGDSGKTTLMDAISAVLSPSWNLSFYDTDFYQCDYNNAIEITVHLVDLPDELCDENKFGLYLRGFDKEKGEIVDDITENRDELIALLTLKLKVDQFMEPKWKIICGRELEAKDISANDRALLKCFLISDFIDRHFSWNKGNPLYTLLRSTETSFQNDDNNIFLDAMRLAKEKFDTHSFDELKKITEIIISKAASIGVNIFGANTTIDVKDLVIKDGRVSLHENSIPIRLKGKGSKRLISLSIQLAGIKDGGIILVDEIEQGLEPDRIKMVARALKENKSGQIFLTTHSREVITELGPESLCYLIRDESNSVLHCKNLNFNIEELTAAVRACPEAFFAKRVIVCEGATEIGFCRALDAYRMTKGKKSMSFLNCAYVDGNGDTMISRASMISETKIKTALFCDSDNPSANANKRNLSNEIVIIDCENNFCLEEQLFTNLPWEAIKDLLNYVLVKHKNSDNVALEASIESKIESKKLPSNWMNVDNAEIRKALSLASTKQEWFKRIDHGEFLGTTVFKYFEQIDQSCHLKKMISTLSDFIDNNA